MDIQRFIMTKIKTSLLLVLMIALVLAAGLIWYLYRPQASGGEKSITLVVVHGDGSTKSFPIRTNAETLGQACKEQGLLSGQEGEHGLYVLTADGETADESQQQWWCLTKGGADHFYGVDETMIREGEQYELTLKTGW